MIPFSLAFIWSLLIHFSKKGSLYNSVLLLLTLFVIPTLPIGSVRINCLYYWNVFLFVYAFFSSRRLQFSIQQIVFIVGLIVVLFLWAFAWVFWGKGDLFSTLIGYIKYIVIFIEFSILFSGLSTDEITKALKCCVGITIFLNLLMCLIQKINPWVANQIIELLFYNDNTINFADSITSSPSIRCFGIYNHPSVLATIALFGMCIYFPKREKDSRFLMEIVLFLSSITIGVFSATKTFFLGFFVILVVFVVSNIKKLKKTRWLAIISLIVVLFGFFLQFFDVIIGYLQKVSPLLSYYLSFVAKPIEAFTTRYSTKSGLLNTNYRIIQSHLVFGVGPNSIQGELINDSAPIVILHNGGMVSIIIILLAYCRLFFAGYKQVGKIALYLFIVIFISGFALPTWVFHDSTIGVLVYFFVICGSATRKQVYLNEPI